MTTTTSYHRGLGYEPLPELFQTNFSRDELAARRAAVFDMIGADDIALVQGAPAPATSEFFRQTNDFYYLSGVEVPHSYLLLDGRPGPRLSTFRTATPPRNAVTGAGCQQRTRRKQ